MKNKLTALIPDFLKQLDHHFLLHNRLIWTTKIHYVLFYGILMTTLSTLIINILPTTTEYFYHPMIFVGILSLVTLIPFGFWIFKQVSFNIEANYGKRTAFTSYFQWLLQLSCILIFVAVPFFAGILSQERIANLVEDTDFVEDINILNQGNPYFPTTEYRDDISKHNVGNNDDYYSYQFERFTPYHYDWEFGKKIQNQQAVYDLYLATTTKEMQLECIENYISVFNRYGGNIDFDAEYIWKGYELKNPSLKIQNLGNQKSKIAENIKTILKAKRSYLIPMTDSVFWLILVTFSFTISVLLSVFQQSQIRDFIIATVSGVGLLMVLGFIEIIASEIFEIGNRNGSNFMIFSLLVYIFFIFQAVSIGKSQTYSRFKTVALILTAVTSPFLIFGLSMLSNALYTGYLFDGGEQELWLGLGLYAVVFIPLFKFLLTRVQALPKG